jgi:hypothetical protein
MARTVEVELRLDSEGAVQRIEAGGQAFERLSDASDEASESLDRNEQAQREAGSAAEQQASANREAAQAAERNETAQREAAQAAQRYAASTDRMAGTAGNANQVIFSTGDAIQDVQFGMAGAANNIAFVAESFAEMQQQAGGTSAALSGVFAALKGPAGLILGLQALLALGPQLVDFFQSWVGGAEEATEAQKELKEETRSTIQNFLSRLRDNPEAAAAGMEVLSQAATRLQQRLGDLFAQGADPDQIDQVSQSLNSVRTVIQSLRRDAQSEDVFMALTDLGVPADIAEQLQDVAASAGEAEQETTDLASASQLLFDEMRSMMDQPMAETIGGQMPDLGRQLNLPALATDIQDVNDLLDAGMLDSIGAINAALGSLDQMLADATGDEKRRRILRLMETLRGMRDEMSSLSQEGIRFGEIIGQGVANAIASMAEAAGSGDNVLQAVGQTLGQLFQRLGKAMIAYGIGLEAVKTLNPTVAIAGGAALIAAGAALNSALSDTQGAIGGAGGGGGGRGFETAGEATGELPVPGRRQGGPVERGQLYETHGLGSREFFVPRTDGAIVTEGSMRAATGKRGGGSTQRVRTQHNVNVEVSDPDLFELRTRLNELESDVSELT